MTSGARAQVRLDAVRANAEFLRTVVPGCKLMATVKANAYGHGLVPVAEELSGADALAVARLVEAKRLRASGIETPIVLLGGATTDNELKQAVTLNCTLVVHGMQQVEIIEQSKLPLGRVWLKIDTGMHRLGIRPSAVSEALERLASTQRVERVGLMTHMANADTPGDPMTRRQLDGFVALTKGFDGDISIANSALLLANAEELSDRKRWGHTGDMWVRPGISLYGISPFLGRVGASMGLRPVMQFEAALIDVKTIARGEPVGYGGTWSAARETVIGMVSAGYGDGYSRFLPSGTPVLVNGRRAPVVGAISMDLTTVDLGPGATDKVGDRVVLWGDGLPVEEIAGLGGTIPYTLVSGITDRAHRWRKREVRAEHA